MRGAAPTAGVKTVSWASPTGRAVSVFALALWNGRDPILKERLFGLTGPEGNHGEDVKELYFYLDSTPTHSYLKALYKYPQAEFPYDELVRVNRERGKGEPEHELLDTGVFEGDRYFDVFAEYAKADADDILVRITVVNRGPEPAPLHVLPTLWFRNTWSWGREGEGYWPKPVLRASGPGRIEAEHASLGRYTLDAELPPDVTARLLFTENESNGARLFGVPDPQPYVKDALHRYVIQGDHGAVNPAATGTKAAVHYALTLQPGESRYIELSACAVTRARPQASARTSLACSTPGCAKPMSSTRSWCPPALPRTSAEWSVRATPASSGPSSSSTTCWIIG